LEASVPAVFPFPEPIPQEIPPRPEIPLIWGLRRFEQPVKKSEMSKKPGQFRIFRWLIMVNNG
jgi:hypothetical protein